MSASVTDTELDQLKSELKSELEKDRPDFEKVRQIISANKHLLNERIDDKWGDYVLHYACEKYAPSNIVIEFINANPLAVQQKGFFGSYPLHFACLYEQSELVIQLLIKEYPLAVQQKDNNGHYPLHYACWKNQSESVIQLLVKEYPLAVQQNNCKGQYPLVNTIINRQNENVVLKLIELFPGAACGINDDDYEYDDEWYPLHLACQYSQSEKVLLVLIHLSLHAVKYKDNNDETPLCIAKKFNQSSKIIKVLEELTTMSDYDLKNCIGIPTIVTLHGLDNLRRNDIFQWVLYNSPILINGEYIYLEKHKTTVSNTR